MNIINLQANDVVVYASESANPVIFPSDGSIQVRMSVENVTPNGIVKRGHWTHTRGLPGPEKDTLYIVSSLVAMFELFHNKRMDLVFPWGMIRANNGNVIACRSLCRPELPTL